MATEKSQLKFVKSDRGELIGFVSRSSHKLIGVRENSKVKKQICVLSQDLKPYVEPELLYKVELKPMHTGRGYVVVSAVPKLFPAKLDMLIVPKSAYKITVTFGLKKIYFDPVNGKSPQSRTIEGVLSVLQQRKDLENKEKVIQDFLNQCELLIQRMEKDGFIYPGKHVDDLR